MKPASQHLRAGERWFDLVLLCLSLTALIIAWRISGFALAGAGTFPTASTAVMVGALIVVMWGNRAKEKQNKEGLLSEIRQTLREVFTRDLVVYTMLMAIYIMVIVPFHFLPSSFLFIALSIIYLKGAGPLKAILISGGTLSVIYTIFLYFFQVSLP